MRRQQTEHSIQSHILIIIFEVSGFHSIPVISQILLQCCLDVPI